MGNFLSKKENDYEKVLADIDSNIQKLQYSITENHRKYRRLKFLFLVTSGCIYIIVLLVAWYDFKWNIFHNENKETMLKWIFNGMSGCLFLLKKILRLGPSTTMDDHHNSNGHLKKSFGSSYPRLSASFTWLIFLSGFPLLVYISNRLITVYFERKLENNKTLLKLYTDKQKLKLEEMKQKTKYYLMKNLIERYEPSSNQKDEQIPETPMVDNKMRRRKKGAETSLVSKPQVLNCVEKSSMTIHPNQYGNANSHSSEVQKDNNIDILSSKTTSSLLPLAPTVESVSGTTIAPYLQKTWMDRIVDAFLGQEDAKTRPLEDEKSSIYALICSRCGGHNGLVPKDDYFLLRYVCPKCGFWNIGKLSTLSSSNVQGVNHPQQTEQPNVIESKVSQDHIIENEFLEHDDSLISEPSMNNIITPLKDDKKHV